MRRRRVLVLDLLTSGPAEGWYSRHVSHPNYFGVMASVVAAWCEDLGAEVELRTYTGAERPEELLAGDWHVAFVSSYTRTAWTAYAVSHVLRQRGTVTALGGPHARAYPQDSRRWFDYVLGMTDRETVQEVLEECAATRAGGRLIDKGSNPQALPSLARRARFVEAALAKAWLIRTVPVLGSTGCPYTCAFCSDATVRFQVLPRVDVEEDVRFATERWPRALLVWHDPNFGVRFDETLDAVERALQGTKGRFVAESTLSILSPDRLTRLERVGFVAMLPGIENWFEYGGKMGIPAGTAHARMEAAADRVNAILSRIPYVQVNFVLGATPAREREESELTREFLRRVPGAWPSLSLLAAWGWSSPLSRELAASGRILDVPFPLIDQKTCWNVRIEGHDLLRELVGTLEQVTSLSAVARRFAVTSGWDTRLVNVLRAWGGEHRQRMRWYRSMLGWLRNDKAFRDFFEGLSPVIPVQLRSLALARLGPFASLLPPSIAELLHTGRRAEPLAEHSALP